MFASSVCVRASPGWPSYDDMNKPSGARQVNLTSTDVGETEGKCLTEARCQCQPWADPETRQGLFDNSWAETVGCRRHSKLELSKKRMRADSSRTEWGAEVYAVLSAVCGLQTGHKMGLAGGVCCTAKRDQTRCPDATRGRESTVVNNVRLDLAAGLEAH